MTVLADPSGPLNDTVPAERAITLRDLLTYTLGTGMVPAEPGTVPIADALNTLGRPPPDEWMRRLGALPLVHQPGERWMYDTAANVTGVLIARATGMSFGNALRRRICDPLGMKDTSFRVSAENIGRMATAYDRDNAATGEPVVEMALARIRSSRRRSKVAAAGSFRQRTTTLPLQRCYSGAVRKGERVLSRPSVRYDERPAEPRAEGSIRVLGPGYFDNMGWGFGMSVRTRRTISAPSVGSYGWPGYYGTAWYNDPAEDMTAIVMMQRAHAGDQRLPMWYDIWTAVYQAIDD